MALCYFQLASEVGVSLMRLSVQPVGSAAISRWIVLESSQGTPSYICYRFAWCVGKQPSYIWGECCVRGQGKIFLPPSPPRTALNCNKIPLGLGRLNMLTVLNFPFHECGSSRKFSFLSSTSIL